MVSLYEYLQNTWLNQDKIYLASPENLPLLLTGAPLLLLFFLWVWRSKLRKRPQETHASRYSKLMDLKLWLGMILAYSLSAFALAKPMIAKSGFETSLGPVEIIFLVDLSLSAHLKYFGDSGPTGLDVAKKQIQAIEQDLTGQDQVSVLYFARSAYEAHPMFPLNQSLRPLFNRAVEEIKLPEKLNIITTYNPTLNFVDSSDIVVALENVYKLYDGTKKIQNPRYIPARAGNRLIFLLSDGDFDINPSNAQSEDETKEINEYRKNLFSALRELRKRGMKIYAVGIGSRRGSPLVNALKKYKKGSGQDYDQEYEDAIIKRGLSRVNPANLKLLVDGAGGNSSIDVIILDRLGANAYDFMRRAIGLHRQISQSKTIESRNDEPLWKMFVVLAIAVTTFSIVGWRVFLVCAVVIYFFGGFAMRHIPVIEWMEKIIRSLV